jgi:hypothetical protein
MLPRARRLPIVPRPGRVGGIGPLSEDTPTRQTHQGQGWNQRSRERSLRDAQMTGKSRIENKSPEPKDEPEDGQRFGLIPGDNRAKGMGCDLALPPSAGCDSDPGLIGISGSWG